MKITTCPDCRETIMDGEQCLCPGWREEFEEWVSSAPYELDTSLHEGDSTWPGQYEDLEVQLAWEAWLEARASLINPQ